MKHLSWLFSPLLLLLASGCSSTLETGTDEEPPQPVCTFFNPIAAGQDPFVVRHAGAYYFIESADNGIWVYRSDDLTRPKQNGVKVWNAPLTGWNRSHVWAPELHFIGGRWYIYYAAGESGPPFIHQRSGVLQSAGADPQGPYTDKGMLYTGDDKAGGAAPVWAIDVTVDSLGGQLYAVWSGWTANQATDKTPQHLYIARMDNPWTIGSERVKISSPVEPWEVGTELDLNEGPQFLRHGDDTFIIYSTRESWLKEYRLGQLRLRSPDADPLDPASWIKSGPVFQGTSEVHGTGHASFTTSPDGTEHWIMYHAKRNTEPGWDRVVRIQPFTWSADGAPNFGTPAPPSTRLNAPSGPCR